MGISSSTMSISTGLMEKPPFPQKIPGPGRAYDKNVSHLHHNCIICFCDLDCQKTAAVFFRPQERRKSPLRFKMRRAASFNYAAGHRSISSEPKARLSSARCANRPGNGSPRSRSSNAARRRAGQPVRFRPPLQPVQIKSQAPEKVQSFSSALASRMARGL